MYVDCFDKWLVKRLYGCVSLTRVNMLDVDGRSCHSFILVLILILNYNLEFEV